MAQRRALALRDVLRELMPPLVNNTEIISDSEPEREAIRLAQKITQVASESPSSTTDSCTPLPPTSVIVPTLKSSMRQDVEDSDEEDNVSRRMRTKLARFKLPSAQLPERQTTTRHSKLLGSRSQSLVDSGWQLTPAQLNKITTCVGCEAKWTSRKTVNQKASHIKSCCRKRGINDETVSSLLLDQLQRSEIGHVSELPAKLGSSGNAVQSTILESVINETKRKKNSRRPAITTVVPVERTRGEIVARGNAILGVEKSSHGPSPWVAHDENSPMLQHRWESKTTDMISDTSTYRRCVDEDDDMGSLLPSTQVYTPSRLVQSRTPHSPFTSASSPPRSRSPTLVISSKEPSPVPLSPEYLMSHAPTIDLEASIDSENTCDAIFEIDAEENEIGKCTACYSVVGRSFPAKTGVHKSFKSKNSSKTLGEQHQLVVDWYDFAAIMRECIKTESALYERILRYEPIQWEVLLNLAYDQGFKHSATLSSKLQEFLDSEAINFFSGGTIIPTNSRSRRRRR